MGKKSLITLAALVVLPVGGWLAFSNRNDPDEPLEITASSASSSEGGKREIQLGDLEPGWVIVGGVKRPASDIGPIERETKSAEVSKTDPMFDYGVTPPVPSDLNPQVKSVVEAIRTKSHPERVSAMIRPKPFDPQAYAADPKKYLETVEPGRVFQVLQPGPGVPRLAAISPRLQTVLQGDSVALRVQAPPGEPVTLTSFDLGEFSNRLNSITIQADEQGLAETKFFGTPGTIDDCNILVGSPSASGTVRFIVTVQLLGEADTASP